MTRSVAVAEAIVQQAAIKNLRHRNARTGAHRVGVRAFRLFSRACYEVKGGSRGEGRDNVEVAKRAEHTGANGRTEKVRGEGGDGGEEEEGGEGQSHRGGFHSW